MVVYRHFKGGLYLFIGVADTHEHNGDRDAVYVNMGNGKLCTRPYERDHRSKPDKDEAWTDMVEWPDGLHRPRFIPDGALLGRERGALEAAWKKKP